MGWKDAPVVGNEQSANQPSWMAAPVVGQNDAQFSDTPQKKPSVSKAETIARGIGQGASMGFGDELMGTIGAGYARLVEPELFEGQSFGDTYKEGRNMVRAEDKAAQEANPKTSFLANLAGGVLTGSKIPLPAARGAKYAAGSGLGALSGYGYSDAETGTRQVLDTALGAGAGAAGVYAGEKVGQGLTALKNSKAGKYVGEAANRGLAALGKDSVKSVDDIAAPIVAQYPA